MVKRTNIYLVEFSNNANKILKGIRGDSLTINFELNNAVNDIGHSVSSLPYKHFYQDESFNGGKNCCINQDLNY